MSCFLLFRRQKIILHEFFSTESARRGESGLAVCWVICAVSGSGLVLDKLENYWQNQQILNEILKKSLKLMWFWWFWKKIHWFLTVFEICSSTVDDPEYGTWPQPKFNFFEFRALNKNWNLHEFSMKFMNFDRIFDGLTTKFASP